MLPIFPQAAVGYDSSQYREKVAKHTECVKDCSGAIFTEQQLFMEKKKQHSWKGVQEREREREREREVDGTGNISICMIIMALSLALLLLMP